LIIAGAIILGSFILLAFRPLVFFILLAVSIWLISLGLIIVVVPWSDGMHGIGITAHEEPWIFIPVFIVMSPFMIKEYYDNKH
jgi:hypothetical protein